MILAFFTVLAVSSIGHVDLPIVLLFFEVPLQRGSRSQTIGNRSDNRAKRARSEVVSSTSSNRHLADNDAW
jgi:hypothetical protein